MSKDRKRPNTTKDHAAAIESRTGTGECPVIVVGVGAPAGGLKSLKQLFAGVPLGRGAAFVLIRSMEPSQESLIVKELRDVTALSVVEAMDGMPVLADRIHVMRPDKFLNITGSTLTLQEPVYCNGMRMPIDHFFCSLAADQGRRGCGILLSGTGSDGVLGVSEIKSKGGETFVEGIDRAELSEELQRAAKTGIIDAVLPADAMAKELVALAERLVADARIVPAESPEFDADLRAVLEILRAKVGHDFRCYKPNTLVRRIRRRMTLAKVATFADYTRLLHEHPDEVGLLQKDLLIGVTEFFRQPQAWEILAAKVIPGLVQRAQPESEIRIWAPGCSTGQEAYSLAMMVAEQVEESGKKVNVQIFATDSDVASLATARSGSYSAEDLGRNVSPERKKRFFMHRDGRYQVIKEIRERVVFAPQNLTSDPPFSRLDLISCRNLLIYLDQQAQGKIVALFHFALREGGFLFLGTAETVGDREDLFEPVSKKWRIYRRIGIGRRVGVEIPVRPTGELQPALGKLAVTGATPTLSLASVAQQMLMDRFAPACVMIDRRLQVLYVHGKVEDYLTFPPGELTTLVVDMAREGLRARLRGAIGKCMEVGRSVSVNARVRRKEKSVPVKATVSPLRHLRETDGLLLVTFEDLRVPTARSRRQAAGESDVRQLEDELKVTREELQSTIEQLESSNDRLKASNEEVTAANEELQSANEELETSKEELQSLNEELNTINTRLQEKVDELESANNDVINLLSSTNIATVFLDKELKVKRYTPAITRLFSLIRSDIGRPVADILRRFHDDVLLDDAHRVLADLTPLAKEVQAEDGRWYIRRITPYRTQDDRIEGVVVTFVDVNDLKHTEEALRQSEERFRAVVEQAAIGIEQLDLDGRIVSTNPMMTQILGYTAEELQRKTVEEITHAEDLPRERELIDQLLAGDVSSYTLEKRYLRKDGNPVWVRVASSLMRDVSGRPRSRVTIIEDITERKRAEEALRKAHDELEIRVQERTRELTETNATLHAEIVDRRRAEEAVKTERQRFHDVLDMLPAYVMVLTPDYHVSFINRFFRERFGEPNGGRCFEWLFKRTEPCEPCETYTVLKTNEPRHWEWTGPDGRNYDIFDFPFTDTDGSPLIMEMGIDITELKRAEESLKEANESLERLVAERTAELAAARSKAISEKNRLSVIVDSIVDGFYAFDREWRITHINEAALGYFRKRVEDMLGHTLFDVFPGFGGSVFETEFRACVESGEPGHIEAPSIVTDGIVEIHLYPGPDNVTVLFRDVTERIRMAEALRESAERFRRLVKLAPIPLSFVNNEGELRHLNDRFIQVFGYTHDDVPTLKEWWQLAYPDEQYRRWVVETWESAVRRAAETNTDIEPIEYRVTCKNGTVRLVVISGITIEDNLLATFIDITERKKQEEELHNLNRTLRALGNADQAMIHAENESDFLKEVCRVVVEDCGHAMVWIGFAEEDEAKSVRPVAQAGFEEGYLETLNVTWADTERGRGPTGAAIRTGRVNICRNMATDPRMVPWREQAIKRGYASSIALPLKAEGRVFGALTIYARKPDPFSEDEVKLLIELADDLAYGITAIRLRLAHRQAEEAVRESELRSRLLSETASQLLASEDPRGIVNQLCRKVMTYLDCHAFFNFLVDEQVGRLHLNAWAGIPEEEARKVEWLDYGVAVCGCVARDGVRIVVDDIFNTPDPRTELVKSYGIQAYACHPLVAQDRLIGTLSFGTRSRSRFSPADLSLMKTVTDQVAIALERMRLIGELQRARDELEMRVRDRTVELSRTNEALAQSNRDLEDFAHIAAHDLQEPLRKIQTFSDRLKTAHLASLDDRARDYLERTQRAAGRMQALVLDLLRYSRVTSRPEPFARFNLKGPVEEAVLDLGVLCEETGGRVEVGELPEVDADRVQMRQLFQNLIGNGLKYHGEEMPVIRVYSRPSPSARFWEIHVADNGIGFDEGYLDRIFKPFQRLHGKNAPYQGTGMGLAICRRIVERHGGSITAKSRPGEGSTFIVKLAGKH